MQNKATITVCCVSICWNVNCQHYSLVRLILSDCCAHLIQAWSWMRCYEEGWKYKESFISIPYKDSIDTEYSSLEICAWGDYSRWEQKWLTLKIHTEGKTSSLNGCPDLAAQQVGANETYAAVCEWNLNNAESLSCNFLYSKVLEVSQNNLKEKRHKNLLLLL